MSDAPPPRFGSIQQDSDLPQVSVVICTYNRADMLRDAIESWFNVKKSETSTELLIVDNASTDTTRPLVERYMKEDDVIRYVHETRPGLSHARNRGIAAARGAIVAYVDDDVLFEPDWLEAIVVAFRERQDIDCVGGKSIPKFEVPRPDWLEDSMLAAYGCTKPGNEEGLMVYPVHPFGVNMAFRRAVLEAVGEFGTDLGRKGNSLLSNEEKDYFYRIDQLGMRVLYLPNAVLHHRVPATRLDKRWLRERAYWQGISKVRFDQRVGGSTKLGLARQLATQSLKYLCSQRHRSFKAQLRRTRLLGEAAESLREILGWKDPA